MPRRSDLVHTFNAVKGWHPYAADILAAIDSATVTFTVPRGRVMHLHSNGKLRTGCHPTAMPLFVFPESDEPDVMDSGGGDIAQVDADDDYWKNIELGVDPEVRCLVASAGYEVESSEFDPGQSYDSTKLLTAPIANTDATTGGRLTPGLPYENPCCGIVSRGVVGSGYGAPSATGRRALALWTIYHPQLTETTLNNIHSDLPTA